MIVTGEKQIKCVRIVAAICALKLEKVGIRVRRGPKVSTQFRKELGLKRTATLDDMIAVLEAQRAEKHAELGIA